MLSDDPLFFLINSYTTGLQPQVIDNLLRLTLRDFDGKSEAYEVGLPTEEGLILPCGCSVKGADSRSRVSEVTSTAAERSQRVKKISGLDFSTLVEMT